jgi:GxxExxY protein
MAELIFKDESFKIVGACMSVYNEMGSGFLEAVYQECLEIEFADRNIGFEAQNQLTLKFKGHQLKSTYIPDFVCFEKIIVEIKGVHALTGVHRAQTINYLKATGLRLGLLVNFGNPKKLEHERIVY